MEREMNKIVIVTRRTGLQELVQKYNTAEQAKFYLEHMGADFADYVEEDRQYRQTLAQVYATAQQYARVQQIERGFVPNMIFGKRDIVIAVGQDGLVANVLKYLDGQPLIGVNPDAGRWDGVLLPFAAGQLKALIPDVIAGRHHIKRVTMAEAVTRDGQRMLAVNDLFIGCRTHTSAKYDITWNGHRENQSSSGIIVSTGLGSTGWYRSVMAQVKRMAAIFQCGPIREDPMAWEDRRLAFVVREPYPSRATQAGIVYGRIEKGESISLVSRMPESGVVFSDGMEEDALAFHSGMEITVRLAGRQGQLVVG